jgi:hypothetical protein
LNDPFSRARQLYSWWDWNVENSSSSRQFIYFDTEREKPFFYLLMFSLDDVQNWAKMSSAMTIWIRGKKWKYNKLWMKRKHLFTVCNTVLIKLCQYAIKREIKIPTSKNVFKYQFWIQQHNLNRLRKVSKQQNIIC